MVPVTSMESVSIRCEVSTLPAISGCLGASILRRVSRSTRELPDSSSSTGTDSSPARFGVASSLRDRNETSNQPLSPLASAVMGCTEEEPAMCTEDRRGSISKCATAPSLVDRHRTRNPGPARAGRDMLEM